MNNIKDQSKLEANIDEPPVSGHPWDQKKCPFKRGVRYNGRLKCSVCM